VQAIFASRAGFLNPMGVTMGPNFIVVVAAATAPRLVQHSTESIPRLSSVGRRWSDLNMYPKPRSSAIFVADIISSIVIPS